MKLCFDVTLDDLVAVHRHYWSAIPTEKWERIKTGLVFAGAAFGLFAVNGMVEVGMLVAVAGVFVFPYLISMNQARDARRHYSSGPGLIGPRELELGRDELVSRSPLVELRVRFAGVERIVDEGDHTFIHLCTKNALVIPHHSITKGNPVEFVAALRTRWAEKPDGAKPVIGANSPS